jgi:hypothetical protein
MNWNWRPAGEQASGTATVNDWQESSGDGRSDLPYHDTDIPAQLNCGRFSRPVHTTRRSRGHGRSRYSTGSPGPDPPGSVSRPQSVCAKPGPASRCALYGSRLRRFLSFHLDQLLICHAALSTQGRARGTSASSLAAGEPCLVHAQRAQTIACTHTSPLSVIHPCVTGNSVGSPEKRWRSARAMVSDHGLHVPVLPMVAPCPATRAGRPRVWARSGMHCCR